MALSYPHCNAAVADDVAAHSRAGAVVAFATCAGWLDVPLEPAWREQYRQVGSAENPKTHAGD